MMRNCSAFFVYICSLSGLNLNTYTLCAFITIQQTFSFFTTYLLPMEKVHIENEIGRLRRVIIHNPGPEIEAMTPREAERDLYNDIIPLAAVQREYSKLRDFLRLVARPMSLRTCSKPAFPTSEQDFNFCKNTAT